MEKVVWPSLKQMGTLEGWYPPQKSHIPVVQIFKYFFPLEDEVVWVFNYFSAIIGLLGSSFRKRLADRTTSCFKQEKLPLHTSQYYVLVPVVPSWTPPTKEWQGGAVHKASFCRSQDNCCCASLSSSNSGFLWNPLNSASERKSPIEWTLHTTEWTLHAVKLLKNSVNGL